MSERSKGLIFYGFMSVHMFIFLGVAKDTRFNPLHVPSKVRRMTRCITVNSHIHHYPGTNVGTSISK